MFSLSIDRMAPRRLQQRFIKSMACAQCAIRSSTSRCCSDQLKQCVSILLTHAAQQSRVRTGICLVAAVHDCRDLVLKLIARTLLQMLLTLPAVTSAIQNLSHVSAVHAAGGPCPVTDHDHDHFFAKRRLTSTTQLRQKGCRRSRSSKRGIPQSTASKCAQLKYFLNRPTVFITTIRLRLERRHDHRFPLKRQEALTLGRANRIHKHS